MLLMQGQVLLLRRAELRRMGQAGLLLGREQLGQVVLLALQRVDLRGRRVAQRWIACSGAPVP